MGEQSERERWIRRNQRYTDPNASDTVFLLGELDSLRSRLTAAEGELQAAQQENQSLRARDQLWNQAFGTTQLTHAKARLEKAERDVERLKAERDKTQKGSKDE